MAEDGIIFSSPEELKDWLEPKPPEWAQHIALRIALRVFPLTFTVTRLPDSILPNERKQGLILQSWRTMFISSAASEWSADEMSSAAARAADAAAHSAAHSAYAAGSYAGSVTGAATDAAYATAYAAGDSPAAADAAEYAASAASAADTTNGAAPVAAIWHAISADCQALDKAASEAESTSAVLRSPLWHGEVQDTGEYLVNLQSWARIPLYEFAAADWVRDSAWSLIPVWYQAWMPDTPDLRAGSIYGESTARELALQPDEFWTVTDDRTPDQIMQEAAEILGWQPLESSDDQELPEVAEQRADIKKASAPIDPDIIREALKRNTVPLLLTVEGLNLQIADYREKTRGDNTLDPATKERLLAFLDDLTGEFDRLGQLISPDSDGPVSDESFKAVATWLGGFRNKLAEDLRELGSPEHAASVTLPVGIILSCGTIGAMLGGTIGFGAGSFVGQLITRHVKPGTIGDKLRDAFKDESSQSDRPTDL